jgi:hypothetical protein
MALLDNRRGNRSLLDVDAQSGVSKARNSHGRERWWGKGGFANAGLVTSSALVDIFASVAEGSIRGDLHI